MTVDTGASIRLNVILHLPIEAKEALVLTTRQYIGMTVQTLAMVGLLY